MNWLVPVTCHRPGLTFSGWLLLAAKRMVAVKKIAKEIVFRTPPSEVVLFRCSYTHPYETMQVRENALRTSALGCGEDIAMLREAQKRGYYAPCDTACVKG
jgi:hypothetical protein